MRLPRPPRAVLVTGVALLVTTLLLGAGASYVYASEVPRGTTVLGVDIGGTSRPEAEAALTDELARRSETLSAPVPVRIGQARTQVRPEAVGLAVDVGATVDAAAAPGWRDPVTTLFGDRTVEPVVTVDAERLDEAVRDTAEEVGEAMTMPEIRFDGTTPVPVHPEPGLGLDPQRSAAALTDAWPRREPPADGWVEPAVVTLPLVELTPVTTADDVDRLLAELARPAVAAPVTITTPGGGAIEASPEAIAASLDLTADAEGRIDPRVDPSALRETLGEQLAEVETEPVDAQVTIDDGEPRIRDSEPGELVDLDQLAGDLLEVLPEPDPRRVAATMTEGEAEVTADDLAELGITEEVSSFTTHFSGGLESPRSENITTVADDVDGTLVLPGETFSLNDHTGERGYDQGYQDAPVIIGGKLVPAVGGGISQFTTTLFNASYYAGLEDVEHHPHSYHYSRYPSVIESTIFYPTLDMRFRNNTPHGIFIDTSYTNDSITVTMYGTKVWDEVETEWGPKYDFVQPRTEYLEPGPDCIATQGIQGYAQNAWRIFIRDGKEVEREKFHWRYDAQPEFICAEEPGGPDD